ncbi:ATPase [Candidatus Parcubacteria bacterium]|nr:MAG: ATPase [Candidatus Parcubacteria bacterium]
MNKKITNKHIKDVYQKFKDFYIKNESSFFEITQKYIVEEIKKIIYAEGTFEWNNASLTDYINTLVYMLKGQQFARTINKFAEQYFIENLCNDFDDTICKNAKSSLEQHKKYYKNVINKNDEVSENNITNKFNIKSINIKNIILYGAPGVGKTHNYKNIISMIEEGRSQNEIFDVVSKNQHVDLKNDAYEGIKKEGRVEFVTFHQSYSYEDFIEGFRPNELGNIELEDGIFKNISSEANNNLVDSFSNNINTNFKSVLEQFQLKFEIGSKLKTYNNISEFIISKYTDKSIHIMVNENRFSISYLPLEEIYNSNKIKPINNPQDVINALSGRFKGLATYYYSIFREMLLFKEIKQNTTALKNFYIVIDEINRGNISKIFGELITLIEEDKRDVYEVTLPYSKEKFKVPSNLYIIATMNSTDKSIATIDIALRRRFTFLKMKPNADLISHAKVKELFNSLNEFIKSNLSEDYMLGHSYFMKIENDDDLAFVKEYKIKPLLEEYFYADDENYKKAIGVLNKENSDE